jgi:hypothetical protein
VRAEHAAERGGGPQHVGGELWVARVEEDAAGCQDAAQESKVDGVFAGEVEGLGVQDALQLAKRDGLRGVGDGLEHCVRVCRGGHGCRGAGGWFERATGGSCEAC